MLIIWLPSNPAVNELWIPVLLGNPKEQYLGEFFYSFWIILTKGDFYKRFNWSLNG